MTRKMLWGNVLIEPIAQTRKTSSGLELPDTQNTRLECGTVKAVGTGSLAIDGSPIPLEVEPEQVVRFKKFESEEIYIEGKKMYIVEQRQIVSIE